MTTDDTVYPKSKSDDPLVPLSPFVSGDSSPYRYGCANDILKALEIAAIPMTRNRIASACKRGRQTVCREIEKLVARGLVECSVVQHGRRTVRYYNLPVTHNRAITRRKDNAYARRCTCGAYVRFRRYTKAGVDVYLFQCAQCGTGYALAAQDLQTMSNPNGQECSS